MPGFPVAVAVPVAEILLVGIYPVLIAALSPFLAARAAAAAAAAA